MSAAAMATEFLPEPEAAAPERDDLLRTLQGVRAFAPPRQAPQVKPELPPLPEHIRARIARLVA